MSDASVDITVWHPSVPLCSCFQEIHKNSRIVNEAEHKCTLVWLKHYSERISLLNDFWVTHNNTGCVWFYCMYCFGLISFTEMTVFIDWIHVYNSHYKMSQCRETVAILGRPNFFLSQMVRSSTWTVNCYFTKQVTKRNP